MKKIPYNKMSRKEKVKADEAVPCSTKGGGNYKKEITKDHPKVRSRSTKPIQPLHTKES